MILRFTLAATSLLLSAAPTPYAANDWIIGSDEFVVYDTINGPLNLDRLQIDAGGTLRAVGPNALRINARMVQVDGLLDLSGMDAAPVFTLNTPSVPEVGAAGGPSGGSGGTASANTTYFTFRGDSGAGPFGIASGGGYGGEGGWSPNNGNSGIFRRAAGGGGGSFGPAELVVPLDPEDRANIGLIALAGVPGASQATGSLFGGQGPIPGAAGPMQFIDVLPKNDFFGTKFLPSGIVQIGELSAPRAGQGGGAGGDGFYLPGGAFPPASLVSSWNDKGAGGGGGGGLAIIQSRRIQIGPEGRILADGGDGAGGENTAGVNRIGGGSGAGSGGMLLLQAADINLSMAQLNALSAIGGEGGPGRNNEYRDIGAGGNGGPGLIQLHVPNGDEASIRLPVGLSIQDLSVPNAHVLGLEVGL